MSDNSTISYNSLMRDLSGLKMFVSHAPLRMPRSVKDCTAWELIRLGLERAAEDAELVWPWTAVRKDQEAVYLMSYPNTMLANQSTMDRMRGAF